MFSRVRPANPGRRVFFRGSQEHGVPALSPRRGHSAGTARYVHRRPDLEEAKVQPDLADV